MRQKEKNIADVSVRFEKHEPERRRSVGGHLFFGCGCCCCCCCLHSLGGLIGAAAATAKKRSPAGGSVAGFYWAVLTLLTVAVGFWACVSTGAAGIIIVLLFLPAVQLAASIVTYIWVAVRSADFPDKQAGLQTLGRITIWSFLAAVAGVIAMIVGSVVFLR